MVTGATGNYGSFVVESLIEMGTSPKSIYALTRNQSNIKKLVSFDVNIVVGDYDHYETMLSSFLGMDKLLFVSSNEILGRNEQHLRVVEAAKNSGVRHILYTSLEHNKSNFSIMDFVLSSHLETEKPL